MRALLIRRPWIDMILSGTKTWEIRGSRTSIRGRIGLIASGSGTVMGVCDLVDCLGPLSATEFRRNAAKAGLTRSDAILGRYRQTYAWLLERPKKLREPIPYEHPNGAVIWVTLSAGVERAVMMQLNQRR